MWCLFKNIINCILAINPECNILIDMPEDKMGKLFICGTPIGNLEDVTLRLLSTLKDVDLIFAEDTRTIRKLLSRYDIKKKEIISYHEHTSPARISYMVSLLEEGRTAALVSESGMPAVQDPGYRLIEKCLDSNIEITVIPGPSAGISALVLSGLPTDSFLFIGFLPRKKEKRKKKIEELSHLSHTLIIYESPRRIEKLLEELIPVFGKRSAALIREITKIHEESIRGRLDRILEAVRSKEMKGEIVLVIEGERREKIESYTDNEIEDRFTELMKQGVTKKDALKVIRSKYDISRQKLYNISTKF
jgi:16S rRNA (cytidine1402-2'-O)-methyltransferase